MIIHEGIKDLSIATTYHISQQISRKFRVKLNIKLHIQQIWSKIKHEKQN